MLLKPTNLAIVDDHVLFRKTLRYYLSEQENINVTLQAATISDMLAKLKTTSVDILLMDLFLPELKGIEAVKLVRTEYPSIKILVVSMSTDMDLISDLLDLGIHGYISKGDDPEDLVQAIYAAAENRLYRNRLFTEALYWNKQNYIQDDIEGSKTRFSEREKRILQLIWEEKSSKEIADELFLGLRSVEKIRQSMKERVGAKSIIGLLKYAINKRFIGNNIRTFLFTLIFILFLPALHAQEGKNEILWDRYGVPHVFAQSTGKMYYEFGWAQMHNHADLILRLYGQARGRAAEYWGEKFLSTDQQVHLFKVPSLAAKEYAAQTAGFKSLLDSFVSGINAYTSAYPDAISPEYRQVLPVRAEDVMAHGIRVVFLRFVAAENLGMASRSGKAGSNSYAIGPLRSTSKNALLLANPHLPWGDLFTFFEAHLQSPGFNAYGAAIVGFPVLNIAFNDHLGWTHTVNPIDACDRYELSTEGGGYWLDSTLVPFEKRSVQIKIKQGDGTLKEQTLEFMDARHGPVAAVNDKKAYAIRIAGLENAHLFEQWHRMAAAENWQQFETAIKMMQLPMFNVIYADARGHIFYLFDGNLPQRPEGDWKFWNGTVDGRYSRYIWQKTVPYDRLPKLFDPSTGFIQNANDPPWNCTWPALLKAADFPPYVAPQGMGLRPQRAVNMIKKDSEITLDKLAGYKLNTGMEAADRFLDDLLSAVQQYPDTLTLKAAGLLKKWDRTCNADSRGAVLFARWFDLLNNDMFSIPWNPGRPEETPVGLKDAKMVVELLGRAARDVIRDYDSLDVRWGDVYRFRLNQLDFPANGGPEQYGVYRTIYFARDPDKKYRAVAGDSYVAITEFGKQVQARVLLSYGNASQPGSKHAGDQLPLLSRKELRPAWLRRPDILQNLEETERF